MIFSAKDTARIALDNSKLDGMTDPPEEMGELERVLYWQLYFLCRRYSSGELDAAYAKKLKNKYITEYEQTALSRRIYAETAERRVRVNVELKKGIESGCEHCRNVLGILDGTLK